MTMLKRDANDYNRIETRMLSTVSLLKIHMSIEEVYRTKRKMQNQEVNFPQGVPLEKR